MFMSQQPRRWEYLHLPLQTLCTRRVLYFRWCQQNSDLDFPRIVKFRWGIYEICFRFAECEDNICPLKHGNMDNSISLRFHAWYIYLHLSLKNQPHVLVGKYTSPKDPVGFEGNLHPYDGHKPCFVCQIKAQHRRWKAPWVASFACKEHIKISILDIKHGGMLNGTSIDHVFPRGKPIQHVAANYKKPSKAQHNLVIIIYPRINYTLPPENWRLELENLLFGKESHLQKFQPLVFQVV